MQRSSSIWFQFVKPKTFRTFSCVMVLGVIIVSFLFAYSAFGNYSESSTLKHASIIFRHGDKNPTSTYAKDPYKEAIFWPEGWGQLTNKGMKQMYNLGQILRSRYGLFLGPYNQKNVRVDSSDHDRCHQSAGALLAALFPPEGDQVWNSDLLWQPIPIHSTPLEQDNLITVKAPCPLYMEEKRRSDEELSKMYDLKYTDLYKYLTDHTGQSVSSLFDVESLYNVLEIEKNSNKDLPHWTVSVFPNKMKEIAALVLASFTYTPIMKRLKGGPLIKTTITNMELVVNGSSTRKMSFYAAHDLTIVNVRRALGFDDVTFKPELGAALIIELHIVDNKPIVELYYIESYKENAPEKWELPGCSAPCQLQSFIDALVSVIPDDWDKECHLS